MNNIIALLNRVEQALPSKGLVTAFNQSRFNLQESNGCWYLLVTESEADYLWPTIRDYTKQGEFGLISSAAMIKHYFSNVTINRHAIRIATSLENAIIVRHKLRGLGFTNPLPYILHGKRGKNSMLTKGTDAHYWD